MERAYIPDLAARELKGHDIFAVKRFQNGTRHMVEFIVRIPYGQYEAGDEVRLFLDEAGFTKLMEEHNRQYIKIKKYAHIIEGHILYDKLKNAHRH